MEFKKAVKTKQKLRLAIDGVSGSGKTYSSLNIAAGISEITGDKIALIDSEHGSASLYADRFEFDTLELEEFKIENYIDALNLAKGEYGIVIIDSTSHAWDDLVWRVEKHAKQVHYGNSFMAWGSFGTPLQKKLVESLLTYPGHVIVTCRSKSEYSVDKDDKGKTTIKKVGTAAVQRQGFEYEFTMAMSMDASHVGTVTKDRTGKFQDNFIEKPGKEMGRQLILWLNSGAAPLPPPPKSLYEQCVDGMKELKNIMLSTVDGMGDGTRLFTDNEYNNIKTILAGLSGKSDNEKWDAVNKLLNAQKQLMYERLEQTMTITDDAAINHDDKPVTPKTESNQTAAPAITDKPEAREPAGPVATEIKKPGEKSLKEEYKQMLKDKVAVNQAVTKTTSGATLAANAAQEVVDDGFVDDIPGEGEDEYEAALKEQADLDIF